MISPFALALALFAARAPVCAPLVDPNVGGQVFVGPTSAHVTSVFWNPAAVGRLQGTHIYLSGTGQADRTTIERSTIDTGTGEPLEGSPIGDAKAFDPLTTTTLLPTAFFGLTSDLRSDRITLGMAVHTPYADTLPKDDSLVYHADGGSFYAAYSTLSLSVRATSSLLFGAGVSLVFTRLRLRFSRDLALDQRCAGACDVENPDKRQGYEITSGGLDLEGDVGSMLGSLSVDAFAYNLGVLFKIEDWWFGASYLSAPKPSFDQDDIVHNASAIVSSPGQPSKTGQALVTFRLPQMIHLGARHAFRPGWDLVLGLRWLDLSAHKHYDLQLTGRELLNDESIPQWMLRHRGWNDVLSVDAGVEHRAGDWLLGATLRAENSAVDPSLVAIDQLDALKLAVGTGAQVRLTPRVVLTLGAGLAYFLPQDVTDSGFRPSEQIACVNADYALDACQASRDGRGLPTAAGAYSRFSLKFNLGLAYDWW
jgi:long-subunit fatty acid transport protein